MVPAPFLYKMLGHIAEETTWGGSDTFFIQHWLLFDKSHICMFDKFAVTTSKFLVRACQNNSIL